MATINSTSANETLTGSTGNDTYIFSDGFGQDSIVDAGGTDALNMAAVTANLTINLNAGAGDEVSDGTNTVNWTGNIIEIAAGGSGNDTLDGGAGNDFISAEIGNDYLIGGTGNDTLTGGLNNDTLDGGSGDDLYIFGSPGVTDNDTDTDIIQDSSGNDTVDFTANRWNYGMTINLTSSSGAEAYVTSVPTRTVNWDNSVIENVIGSIAADSITGSSAANNIDGNDTLIGMGGNDTLKGGTGNDVYQFAEGDGQDVVIENDATAGNSDQVVFDSSVSQSVVALFQDTSGNLQIGYTDSAGDLITVQGFNSAAGQIERFELNNGYYMTNADVNQVISDMAAYAATNSISINNISDVENNAGLLAIVNGGWHT